MRPRRAADPPILVVEDKDSLRAMLRLALEGQGYSVIEARDQPEAVQALRSSRPGVVLSDLRLPEGDGFGVLRAAKELDPGAAGDRHDRRTARSRTPSRPSRTARSTSSPSRSIPSTCS